MDTLQNQFRLVYSIPPVKKPISRFPGSALAIALTTLLLHGCGTAPVTPQARVEAPASVESAAQAEQQDEYVLAARRYDELASTAPDNRRPYFQLKAIEALIKAGQYHQAKLKLQQVDTSRRDPSILARQLMLQAQVASHEGQHEQALRMLSRAKAARSLDPSLHSEILRTLADTELALNHPVLAARHLVQREKFMVDSEAIHANQLRIWETLTAAEYSKLVSERKRIRDPVLGGWLELAIRHADGPTAFNQTLKTWKKQHPHHTATPELLKTLASPPPRLIGRIQRIGLLLPLQSTSNSYIHAAKAVQEGIATMRDADTRPQRPQIKVYEYGNSPAEAVAAYKNATRDGMQLVIGPLGREAAEAVVGDTDLTTPTLLLSHVESDIDFANAPLFQFALAPEQEARQAAERAYLDGHRQAAVLYPLDSWGERMRKAFEEHWERLGGLVIKSTGYETRQADYSDPVKMTLDIQQSEARRDELAALTRLKLTFEPRRRQDIDCIFLAADPRHARLIKPQLNYHRGSRIPVYSTSHVFAGRENRIKDADLDGIYFGDMPWMLLQNGDIGALRLLQGNWSYARSQLDRLYALGMDSYAVIPYLNRIGSDNAVRFNGVTSGLSIDHKGRIHRQLLWARFRRGIPRSLDQHYRYTDQFILDHAKGVAPQSGR